MAPPAQDPSAPEPAGEPLVTPDDILVIRRGPGANCSSIGSALDILFLSAVAGGVILAGVAAAFPRAGAPPQAGVAPPQPQAAPPREDDDARPT